MLIVALLFVAIVALVLFIDSRKPKGFPPGPTWYPILGSAKELAELRKETGYLYVACKELARRYGNIVGIRVGKDRQVILSGYPAIKEMLTRDEFDGRPRGPFYQTRTWGERRGLLVVDSDFWQEQRRFVIRHLREFGFGRGTMADLVQNEASEMVRAFQQKIEESPGRNGVVLSMHDSFGVYVLNTLWTMLAGIRYSPEDAELLRLQSMLTDLFTKIDMAGALFSQFPILQYIAPGKSGYNEFVAIHQRVWKFLREELEKHKMTYSPNEMRDFMDVYIKMLNSSECKPSFSEGQLLAICMDMFMAGSETTSKSLGFGFLYLLRHPEVQKKAQAEIDAVVGRNRLPELADRPNMPYLEALVLESVRMFMGRTFLIPHRALSDTHFMGYHIPKDTMMIANTSTVLMDKEFWGDPEIFRPDRFINQEGKVVIPDQYLPFGFGKHRCLGETLAKSNVFIFCASLLQNFEFHVPPGEDLPSTQCLDGVTAAPIPYNALVVPRPL